MLLPALERKQFHFSVALGLQTQAHLRYSSIVRKKIFHEK